MSHVIGIYGPTATPTVNAATNYARFDLGSFQAGTSLRTGTCGMAEAAFERNDDINGAMFRFGGGSYIVPNRDPKRETFFIYGTEHYLQKTPRAALFNES